jgi:hypothetical protein
LKILDSSPRSNALRKREGIAAGKTIILKEAKISIFLKQAACGKKISFQTAEKRKIVLIIHHSGKRDLRFLKPGVPFGHLIFSRLGRFVDRYQGQDIFILLVVGIALS